MNVSPDVRSVIDFLFYAFRRHTHLTLIHNMKRSDWRAHDGFMRSSAIDDADELCFLLSCVRSCVRRARQDLYTVASSSGGGTSAEDLANSFSALLRSCLQLYNALESSQDHPGLNFLEDTAKTLPHVHRTIQCTDDLLQAMAGDSAVQPSSTHDATRVEAAAAGVAVSPAEDAAVIESVVFLKATLSVLLEEMNKAPSVEVKEHHSQGLKRVRNFSSEAAV